MLVSVEIDRRIGQSVSDRDQISFPESSKPFFPNDSWRLSPYACLSQCSNIGVHSLHLKEKQKKENFFLYKKYKLFSKRRNLKSMEEENLRTWKSMVSLASGAVQVLLRAPATPPATSWDIVPIWDCWCIDCCGRCCGCGVRFLTPPSTATPPWTVFRALCPPSTTIPTLASVCIVLQESQKPSLSLSKTQTPVAPLLLFLVLWAWFERMHRCFQNDAVRPRFSLSLSNQEEWKSGLAKTGSIRSNRWMIWLYRLAGVKRLLIALSSVLK